MQQSEMRVNWNELKVVPLLEFIVFFGLIIDLGIFTVS